MSGDDADGAAAGTITAPGRLATRGLLTAVDGSVAANQMAASGTSTLLRGTARATEANLGATRTGVRLLTGDRVDGAVDELFEGYAASTVGRLDTAAADAARAAARTDQSLGIARTIVHASAAAAFGPITDHGDTAEAVEIEL